MLNLKGLMMILELHRQGLAISVIAQRTGHDRKTVRKYIQRGLAAPKYKPRAARTGALDDFRSYLQERLQAWPELTGSRLLREIRVLRISVADGHSVRFLLDSGNGGNWTPGSAPLDTRSLLPVGIDSAAPSCHVGCQGG